MPRNRNRNVISGNTTHVRQCLFSNIEDVCGETESKALSLK